MKNKYIEYIKSHHDFETGIALQALLNNGYVDEIQSVLVKLGQDIEEDGLLGFETLNAIDNVDEDVFWKTLEDHIKGIQKEESEDEGLKEERVDSRQKQAIMNFLYAYEGKRIEWLHGEKSVTAPLGVYCHAMPKSGPCRYIRKLYKKYKLSFSTRAHARILNNRITVSERQELFDLAWDHYKSTYLGDEVGDILKTFPKSSLSYFSNSINGGKSRGNKSLQSAIGVKVDGKIGNHTISTLKLYTIRNTDNKLNKGILDYMADFYKYLVCKSKRRSHFRQFAKGWINRIKSLGYNGKYIKC